MILDTVKVGDTCPFPDTTEIGRGTGGVVSTAYRKNHKGQNYIFLPFVPNGINGVIASGADVISYPFSGCYMAAYNNALNVRCVCHVSTGAASGDCTEAWKTYKTGKTVHLEFKPWNLWNDDKKVDFKFAVPISGVYGVITGANEGYGLLVHPITKKILDIRKYGAKAPWRVFTKVFK